MAKSLTESIEQALANNELRKAERMLHAFNYMVSDHTDLDKGERVITWHTGWRRALSAPRYLHDPTAAANIVIVACKQLRGIVPGMDEEVIIATALRKVARVKGFAYFSTLNKRIAHAIVLELVKQSKGI